MTITYKKIILLSFAFIVIGCSSPKHHTQQITGMDYAFGSSDVRELTEYADVVVRIEVLNTQKTRVFENVKDKNSDEYLESAFPYTDSVLKVLEVYKGDVKNNVTVTQLGGDVVDGYGNTKSWVGHFLEKRGEYVLFLDLQEGEFHRKQGKDIYVEINETSRYKVDGFNIVPPHSPIIMSQEEIDALDLPPEEQFSYEDQHILPTTLEELEAQIQQGLSWKNGFNQD